MQSIKTILWPTDGSKSALEALKAAVTLAGAFDAEIHALQVVEPMPRPAQIGFAGDPVTTFDFPLYEKQLIDFAGTKLQETVNEKVPDAIRTETHVELGSPKDSILEFCRSREVDLIVMATHGRQGLAHVWLGSVAESTVRQASVPVLVVPLADTEKKEE